MDMSRYQRQLLREDDSFVLYRGISEDGNNSVLMKASVSTDSSHEGLQRLEGEMSLADRLEPNWAAKPLALERHGGQTFLLLTDGGGMPLSNSGEEAFDTGFCLSVACNATAALRKAHARGVVHKDLRPPNLLIDAFGKVWLTGFGKAGPAGTASEASGGLQGGQLNSLPYIAPEQTGRIKRSVDARSDLYALGVVLYEMLTGELPFVAVDAVEWVHAHVARRPIPLHQRNETTPPVLERIVLKLLAKRPEDRYQTAAALEGDLQRCLDSWNSTGRINEFEVASGEAADRLRAPQGLYGRSRQTGAIWAAFDRVRSHGVTEVVLVSGPAGVGKSSVVHELRKSLAATGSPFASGKFDQYTRDVPYATVAQAFRSLVRQMLGFGDADLERWRQELVEALGPNGRLMINLVPELVLIIGEQPPPPDLQPHEAKARFHLVFRRFLAVFARPERPLVLFIDDVQWLDAATIELVEAITLDPDVRNLLLICAYRDDEVPPQHPFNATREAMRDNLDKLEELRLGPLTPQDVGNLLTDILRLDGHPVGPLARLVIDKTEGNPFFVLQFLASMEDEGLVEFDADKRRWRWDADRIRNTRVTDNVAELVASKLSRLPRLTLETVKVLACIGSGASLATLSIVCGKPERQIVAILWEAVQARFLLRVDDAFQFAHDRVQEAAYLLVPAADRPVAHIQIGRSLISKLAPAAIQERIFEVIDQFGRGLGQVSDDERERVAALFLEAGVRAKTSVAYPSALKYFRTGRGLLKPSHWGTMYDLIFALELQQAECEYLTGDHAVANDHLLELSMRARDRVDGAAVVRLRSSLYVTLGDQAKAVEVALVYLRDFGIDWSPHPTEQELRVEIEALRGLLADRRIEDLVELPRMTDPDWLAAMDVLAYTILPAILTDGNLEDLIYTEMVSLSLQHGNCDASCYAYVSIMVALGLRFGDYDSGGRFGDVGLALVDGHGMDRFKTRTYTCYACFVVPWTKPLRISEKFSRKAIEVGVAAGDLVFIVTTSQMLVSHLLVAGADLALVEEEAERFLASARRTGFSLAADAAIGQLLLIRELRGLDGPETPGGSLLPEKASYQQHLQDAGAQLMLPLAWYWIQQMQARYVAGEYASAIEAEREGRGVVQATRSFVDIAEYHFYAALIHASVCETAAGEDRREHFEAIRRHQEQIETWAASGPENHGNRRALVAAEVARLENRDMEALRLYEEAARSARQYGFIQNEAMANELASRFCVERGLKTSATAFLRNARSCYLAWGANGKVRRLDLANPGLNPDLNGKRTSLGSEAQHLDMAAVLSMSQAVSGEIVLDHLIERLMITVVEHAGAVRALLLLPSGGEMHIVAEALTHDNGVAVRLEGFERRLPETILSYVTRTQEVVLLDDARGAELFSSDPYVEETGSSSILCLPLVKQKKLVGVLYLENGLSPHLFTQDQVAVLQLLASQAAISLENASLFREAQETHERARRVAEELRLSYDMIPALAWNAGPDGLDPVFNKQWHDYTGITPEAARQGAWLESIHPEDREKVVQKWTDLVVTGNAGEIEARVLRHDGVSRSFLIRGRPMRDETGAILKWFGTHTDIDDLKRIEEAQQVLARAGRLTALGELTASIAHEVNQPLMAIVMNAGTCLRWLSDDQLDVDEARQAAERIIRDGHRAGEVITSIRALAKKSPLIMENVDVNAMIEDVLVLTRGELQRHGIALKKTLSADAGSALGDRIQLQQVVLNLILNAVEAIGSSERRTRRLHVTSEMSDNGKVSISIADSGPGVEPAKLDQIFEAFFTTKPGGLGMGLSICRSIVEAHGGGLRVSPNEPEGSVFSFTLKAAAT